MQAAKYYTNKFCNMSAAEKTMIDKRFRRRYAVQINTSITKKTR